MEDNILHVYPVKDTEDHILQTEWKTHEYGTIVDGRPKHNVEQRLICKCKCVVRIIEENGSFVIVHSSFDGREGVEIANEIISNGLFQ
jgi:hypothetical protein